MIRPIPKYLIIISCQQKTLWISQQEISIVVKHLEACGVNFTSKQYENSGQYGQLHLHGIATFSGRYKPLTKWGDQKMDKSFRIDFKRIRKGTMPQVVAYINKERFEDAKTLNKFKQYYYNQDLNNFQFINPINT